MKVFASVDELQASVGTELEPGPWFDITQENVNAFADATGDQQWIHTDPERAAKGPFGRTIAHGYLTLSLLPMLMKDLYRVENISMGVNYGLNKVRFPAPSPVGGAVRVRGVISEVTPVAGGVQVVTTVTVESNSGDKPVCVAETVSRIYASGNAS